MLFWDLDDPLVASRCKTRILAIPGGSKSLISKDLEVEICISEPRNIDFEVGVDLMDPLQMLLAAE